MNSRQAIKKLRRAGYVILDQDDAHLSVCNAEGVKLAYVPRPGNKRAVDLGTDPHNFGKIRKLLR